MNSQLLLTKYADLLVNYCLELKKGERVLVKSSTLAIPLVQEVHKFATKAGAFSEFDIDFEGKTESFYKYADEDLLKMEPVFYGEAVKNFDAYLLIRAPFDLHAAARIDPTKKEVRRAHMHDIQQTYFTRTASGELKRTLCEYPTEAAAQMAGLSLEEYSNFIFDACMLTADNPRSNWLDVRKRQQHIVDFLNDKSAIRYKNKNSDISFSTKDRIWINSDGRSNMPSGEVYTGPVEESVNGVMHFDFPSIFQGKEVEGIELQVESGKIVKWSAKKGQDLLDTIFNIPGANYFGEAAIGTNYNISRPTKNILFDEKIGGTVHMAVGQSYAQTGAKNKSSIHWDMISDMRNDGEIFADGELIYKNGKFLI